MLEVDGELNHDFHFITLREAPRCFGNLSLLRLLVIGSSIVVFPNVLGLSDNKILLYSLLLQAQNQPLHRLLVLNERMPDTERSFGYCYPKRRKTRFNLTPNQNQHSSKSELNIVF